MANLTQNFRFTHPLKHKVVRDLKIVTEQVGELVIEGTGYLNTSASRIDIFDRFSVDIDSIKWTGTDITPVLVVMGGMDEIQEASIRHFAKLMEQKEVEHA